MAVLVRALEIWTPECVKRRALIQLFNFTAAAFEAKVPPVIGLDSTECLARYARFTQTHAEQRLREGRGIEAIEAQLYQNAVELGQQHGKQLRLGDVEDVMAIGRVLYRILGIDFQGDAQGEVVINRCYFSRFYSGEVCRLMSAMDRGLFAGLSNGGELNFSSRITEGQPYCRAHFSWEPKAAQHSEQNRGAHPTENRRAGRSETL
jgi:hypothetical protein